MTEAAAVTRRLFFALWPDEPTRRAIRKVAHAAVRRAGGRPVPAGNYHITLAFLGSQPAALLEDIVGAGRGVSAQVAGFPLELQLDRFGYWPRARVFWLAPSQCPETLASLALSLWSGMEACGLARDNRVLRPHVTLCRKVQRAPDLAPPRPVRWRAMDFVLAESVTAPAGAEYTVVARFPDSSSHDP